MPITTKEEFQLKNGSTLPIKFNATNSNNEFVSDSTVKVEVIDSEGTWQTFVTFKSQPAVFVASISYYIAHIPFAVITAIWIITTLFFWIDR